MKKFRKIGVLTSGGDAPGMNACIRAITRKAIEEGVEVVGIVGGYTGLIESNFVPLTPRSVSNIITRGGTMLYSNRCPELKTEEGMQKAIKTCRENGIDAIVAIGGDGTFRGATELTHHGVPAIGIPGTIDNDITATDNTIGYDTAMNTVLSLIDDLRDTCESHARCNVVEVMGRGAGHIAVNTGIACGATDIITQEVPYNIDAIANTMLEKKAKGKQNFVVIVAEGIGHSQEIATALQEKTGIEARATILGHVQRGGNPTLRDRVEATRMGYYAVELIEQGIGNRVVGIKDSKIVDYDIQEALSMKKPYDEKLHHIAEEIAF